MPIASVACASGDNAPSDTLHHAPRPGLNFGFPFCHQGDILDPDFGVGRSCSEFAPPLLKLGPHVAGMGIRFYTGNMFPPQYRNVAFIALKGSWNRTEKSGYKVDMFVAVDVGSTDVWYGALRITQYKFFYTSPGAHTLESRDSPSPSQKRSQSSGWLSGPNSSSKRLARMA